LPPNAILEESKIKAILNEGMRVALNVERVVTALGNARMEMGKIKSQKKANALCVTSQDIGLAIAPTRHLGPKVEGGGAATSQRRRPRT
jgi:hypothetical protein